MFRHDQKLLGFFVLFFCMTHQASAFTVPSNLGYGATSVSPPGYPSFFDTSTVTFAKLADGSFQLSATGDASNLSFGSSASAAQQWAVSGGTFNLVANFSDALVFNSTGSSVSVGGHIPGYSGIGVVTYGGTTVTNNTPSTLFSANLLRSAQSNTTPYGLGFTSDYGSAGGWGAQFMNSNESVWFYDNNSLWSVILADVSLNAHRQTWSATIGTSISTLTTVPLPGAVWLFGCACLILTQRRRSARCVQRTRRL